MYRRANLTGVNPLVYYLVGANRTLDAYVYAYVYICRKDFKRPYKHVGRRAFALSPFPV